MGAGVGTRAAQVHWGVVGRMATACAAGWLFWQAKRSEDHVTAADV